MNDMDDKLIQAFADAFFAHLKHGDEAHQKWLREETDKFFAEKAPAFRSAILADAAKGVEPVAIYHGRCVIDCGEHGHLDMQLLKMIPAGSALVPASTLAAAQALNAELVSRVAELGAALRTADRTFAENGILASHAARQEIQSALTKGQP